MTSRALIKNSNAPIHESIWDEDPTAGMVELRKKKKKRMRVHKWDVIAHWADSRDGPANGNTYIMKTAVERMTHA